MQNFFAPHPYSTRVGLLTERATDSGQPSENWALILEICDTIAETDDGPKEAARAIRKRFVSSAGKDPISIWYTLLLLDACVRNCGRRFHNQVANKEFLHDFLKLLSPKYEPSQDLQTTVLFMLKAWAEANWDVPGRRELEKIYNTLRQKGIHFPSVAPCVFYKRAFAKAFIQNPTRSPKRRNKRVPMGNGDFINDFVPPISASVAPEFPDARTLTGPLEQPPLCVSCGLCHAKPMSRNVTPPEVRLPVCSCRHRDLDWSKRRQTDGQYASMVRAIEAPQPIDLNRSPPDHHMEFGTDGTVCRLSASQRVKLTQDLSVIETNVNVLNDVLAELRPDTATPDDLALLRELYETCRAMHDRVVEFLGQVSDEEVAPSLLQVNDNLNNAFSRYDRFERYRLPQIACNSSSGLLALGAPQSNSNARDSSSLLALTSGTGDPPGETRADDEPLISLGTENTNETTSHSLLDTDELAGWVISRQFPPSPPAAQTVVSSSLPNSMPANVAHITGALDGLALVPTTTTNILSSTPRPFYQPANSTHYTPPIPTSSNPFAVSLVSTPAKSQPTGESADLLQF